MAGLKIDLDRDILYEVAAERRPRGGVVIRRDKETGADVFMYRNDPGVYYSSNGVEVSPILAKKAGFDIERLEQERVKRLKMREFEADWNAKMNVATKRIVETRGKFRLVDLGDNRFIVEDLDGANMTAGKQANTVEMGLDWLEFFAGPEVPANQQGTVLNRPPISAILQQEGPSNVNVSGIGRPGESRADRRAGEDGREGQQLGKPGYSKAPVPA